MKEHASNLIGTLLQAHEMYVMRGVAHTEDLEEIESNFKEALKVTYQVLTGDIMSESIYQEFTNTFEI